jgi:hypothetical protein
MRDGITLASHVPPRGPSKEFRGTIMTKNIEIPPMNKLFR